MTPRILHVETLLALAAHDGDDYDAIDLFGTENALQAELAALAHEYALLSEAHAALLQRQERAASLIQAELNTLEYDTQMNAYQQLAVRRIRRVVKGVKP